MAFQKIESADDLEPLPLRDRPVAVQSSLENIQHIARELKEGGIKVLLAEVTPAERLKLLVKTAPDPHLKPLKMPFEDLADTIRKMHAESVAAYGEQAAELGIDS